MKIEIKGARLGFPRLFKPEAYGDNPTPQFSAVFLFEPGSPAAKKVEEAMTSAATEKWGVKAPQILAALKAQGRVCLRDGATKANVDGFEGMLFVKAAAPTRPLIIDRDKAPLAEESGKPYAGCYVSGIVDIYAQDSPKWGKRINATLKGVMFVRDGEAFAGGPAATESDFTEVDADEMGLLS